MPPLLACGKCEIIKVSFKLLVCGDVLCRASSAYEGNTGFSTVILNTDQLRSQTTHPQYTLNILTMLVTSGVGRKHSPANSADIAECLLIQFNYALSP